MATGTDDDYITPHRQFATYEPEDDAKPPPIVKKPNMECSKEPVKSWADYTDDEPLPEVIFGKTMKPIVTKNLLKEFNSTDDNWRRNESEGWTVVNRSKSKWGNWDKKSSKM
tara:strand:+ start:1495 stop:1830 length:336 start_codon:yes stop_codon:yes gene_type:complete